ncbi:PAS domain-containing protein [Massilia phyllostachyos]
MPGPCAARRRPCSRGRCSATRSRAAARQWTEAVAARGMVDARFRVRRADGAWRLMAVRAAPLVGADGRIRKWVGLNVEVDEGAPPDPA